MTGSLGEHWGSYGLDLVCWSSFHLVQCWEDLQHLGHSDRSCTTLRISILFLPCISVNPLWPDLSSSYISNTHLNFSLALPDVGIFEAMRNSWQKCDKTWEVTALHCWILTLKSMLPLLSSSKILKSWSTNILAMPGGRRRQYMSNSFCLWLCGLRYLCWMQIVSQGQTWSLTWCGLVRFCLCGSVKS